MKNLLFIVFTSILLFTGHATELRPEKTNKHIATCYGNSTCYACKNCKYCAHCNSGGGTCGVCSSSPATNNKKPIVKSSSTTSRSSSQCQGTTKKGARCKRMVRGGGYCYQHSS
ncbi:DUF5763 domain-containing protein [Pedobacter sp. MR2016-24]|uniref:DUF5763 domain-containing protein n=1 Tax=Pedobacter sp. MR2016-24 TaxID=2994466 RepID=UPI00224582BF|nr:DUF5763 domain-containing protein [Pedobacter sp. MR2016-24]MCX2483791.1 DUF5763 domain-containing protein [Pedobacter sp. MR2016-24]